MHQSRQRGASPPSLPVTALLMRPLNGKYIDQSVYNSSNCITLQSEDRVKQTPQVNTTD